MRFIKFRLIHFFILVSFFYGTSLNGQALRKFEHIDLPTEISDSKALCILEDSNGLIWFGFVNGLVVYNGYKGKRVKSIFEDGSVRGFGSVNSLIDDANGNLWVGTSSGVYIYNPIKETAVSLNDSRIKEKACNSLSATAKGEILVGTTDGLFIYSSKGDLLEQYIHQPGFKNSLSNNLIRCSYGDNNGNIWIGTYDKLNLLERKEKKFSHFRLQRKDSLFHSNNLIISIKPFEKNNDSILLVGTESGLCLFNRITKEFTQFSHKESENSISNSVVKSLCRVDNQLWLGTDLGLNSFDIKKKNFANYYHDFNSSFSISSNVVNGIYFDSNRNLWIATDSGIDKIYLNPGNVLLNRFYENSSFFREGIEINNFSSQSNGDIWIATQQGAFKYDRSNNSFEQFLPPRILHNKVTDIHCDENGLVWIATDGGLNIFNPKENKFSSYVAQLTEGNVLTTNYIKTISQDSKGTIWIGTFNRGIFKIVKKKNGNFEFINFKHEIANENSISSNSIFDLAIDKNDNVWIATSKGINCFYILNGVFERFIDNTKYPNSPNQTVFQLFFDYEDVLWISSYSGLFQWNSKFNKFIHFKNLPNNVSSTVAIDSTVYFIADSKFYYFDKYANEILRFPNYRIGLRNIKNVKLIAPKTLLIHGRTGFASLSVNDLILKEDIADIKWTSFSISNVEIKPYTKYNSRYIINKHIDATDTIVLKHDENSFRIDFSSFPFNSKKDVEYNYILEDYESDWSILKDGQNYVSYTQVRPGKYKLKVKASNNQGLFNSEERVLNIIVKPPGYLSWWALLIYLACFVLLILYYRRILIQREREKNELKFEKLEHQKSEELIALKTRFFTNITHELKTPLTLISSPVDDLLTKQLDESTLKSLSLVKRNTDRLKKLVNQILDIRRIEAGGEKLRIQRYDIIKFCNQIVNQFKDESVKRDIFLQFSSEIQRQIIWFDLEKVEKILVNLLSNAFKFTPDNGTIRVSIDSGQETTEDNRYIFITVSDTGRGISKEDQTHLFDRFNSSLSVPYYSNQKGTGIGMSIIYEYTALHNGSVKFDSMLDMGSKFTFSLPKDKSMLKNYEIVESLKDENQEESEEIEKILNDEKEFVNENIEGDTFLKALIVEDNADMREFLTDGLMSKYVVVEAEDGREGFNLAIKELPDIIVSDLMMPGIDGIEFCRKLKADIRTSHIPFILLTAKGDLESRISGIETGADDYIRKPFNLEHLTVRMKSLIKQRESLRKVYLQQMKLEPSEITVNSLDENFLDELLAKIEMEMDNSELSVKLLSKMLGISSTNLYRKIKALTGQTATEFIRNIRLKRAAQLLKSKELNVSEVMYMVGFTHHSYFTRCFKELFGVSPKSFVE
jgi:signal transduction histidine kinase/ligand-binding sensor domain-containing protein/DNA-binding response OmpR family regulator